MKRSSIITKACLSEQVKKCDQIKVMSAVVHELTESVGRVLISLP